MTDLFMSTHQQTVTQIQNILEQWGAQSVLVTDNSHLHVGHEGAKSGGGHFAVRIVADFGDQNRIQRHRLVHKLLHELWDQGKIHALEVEALKLEDSI